MTGEAGTRDLISSVWEDQSVWSQTANLLKARLDHHRSTILALTVASAILTTLASQTLSWSPSGSKVLALSAGVTVGLVPVVRSRLGRDAVSRWTRARAVSEELKAEVYRFLAGVAPFREVDREAQLVQRTQQVLDEAGDLLAYTAGVVPVVREVPPVHDVDSYVRGRLEPQIQWYRGRSARLSRQLAAARLAELCLGLVGVVLGAAAAVWSVDAIAAWVAVVTTLTAALTAHVAASRWEYQLVEYLRTANELNRLRGEWLSASVAAHDEAAEDGLVERCEHVVSIQNDGWMAKWTADQT